jgi:hypothetical protein
MHQWFLPETNTQHQKKKVGWNSQGMSLISSSFHRVAVGSTQANCFLCCSYRSKIQYFVLFSVVTSCQVFYQCPLRGLTYLPTYPCSHVPEVSFDLWKHRNVVGVRYPPSFSHQHVLDWLFSKAKEIVNFFPEQTLNYFFFLVLNTNMNLKLVFLEFLVNLMRDGGVALWQNAGLALLRPWIWFPAIKKKKSKKKINELQDKGMNPSQMNLEIQPIIIKWIP